MDSLVELTEWVNKTDDPDERFIRFLMVSRKIPFYSKRIVIPLSMDILLRLRYVVGITSTLPRESLNREDETLLMDSWNNLREMIGSPVYRTYDSPLNLEQTLIDIKKDYEEAIRRRRADPDRPLTLQA